MDSINETNVGTHTLYPGNNEIEIWENPEVNFGVSPPELRQYEKDGDWVALFNAFTLLGARAA